MPRAKKYMSTKNLTLSKAARQMTEIILDALNDFPEAERADRLKDYKDHLSAGIRFRPSARYGHSTRNGSRHI